MIFHTKEYGMTSGKASFPPTHFPKNALLYLYPMTITERVDALRQWMKAQEDKAHIKAYIVPTADPHNDEYIPEHWMCREWITGFTGSAGTAVITADDALLWTDSRYWLQAEEQLKDTPFRLMKDGAEGVPSIEEWLHTIASMDNQHIFMPADLAIADTLQTCGLRWTSVQAAMPSAFDSIWAERPSLPAATIDMQPVKWAGSDTNSKLKRLKDVLRTTSDATDFLFNDLSDIAWVLNLRGSDIPYNPVFVSFLLYNREADTFTLFTHGETLSQAAQLQLSAAHVSVQPYEAAAQYCKDHVIAFDEATVPYQLVQGEALNTFASPLAAWRAEKNEAECEGFRQAMLRDGVAMVKFLRWLDENMQAGNEVTELSVDERLTALRAEQAGYKELSFATIAACGAHGAIVHYEADKHTNVRLPQHGLLLLDSGAQYDCGTTDITRTIALGHLTAEERHVYTLVMKGHLRLARMHFPEGTTGLQLDLAARQDMWAEGYDFGHGTGHGVGSHLCVHEGPHQIRKNVRACTLVPFRKGMTITDEPGLYIEGRFGVRIENTLLCTTDRTTDFGHFLRFETLTLCPYDLRPLDISLLTDEEVEQINAYHARVRHTIMPLLEDEADKLWLAKATTAIAIEDN